jgi:hypothetical protein
MSDLKQRYEEIQKERKKIEREYTMTLASVERREGAVVQEFFDQIDQYKDKMQPHLRDQFRKNDLEVGTWDCEPSPIGVCVYDLENDPICDHCLFCGDPDERK